MQDVEVYRAFLKERGIELSEEEFIPVMEFLESVLVINRNSVKNDYIATGHLVDEINRQLELSGEELRFRVIENSDNE